MHQYLCHMTSAHAFRSMTSGYINPVVKIAAFPIALTSAVLHSFHHAGETTLPLVDASLHAALSQGILLLFASYKNLNVSAFESHCCQLESPERDCSKRHFRLTCSTRKMFSCWPHPQGKKFSTTLSSTRRIIIFCLQSMTEIADVLGEKRFPRTYRSPRTWMSSPLRAGTCTTVYIVQSCCTVCRSVTTF